MCRRNQLWGLAMLTFGLGLLLGCWVESGLGCICCGFGFLIGGVVLIQKK